MKISIEAKSLAFSTSDAYSSDRFRNWAAVIQALLNLGYTELETEAILRSKWPRWACDRDPKRYGHCTSSTMVRFLEDMPKEEVNKLVNETFGDQLAIN